MTIWGYIVWGVAILIALVPIIGLIAEVFEWHKDKTINDYERKKNDKQE